MKSGSFGAFDLFTAAEDRLRGPARPGFPRDFATVTVTSRHRHTANDRPAPPVLARRPYWSAART
ncbi:hypothetical protein, partial [Streptomyces sp. PU-14G]|uniref:hypothetical protein n=1 Tax=Streptomyces sp. PU-14G TaxID=2800808 RepID=UPI0034E0415E